MGIKLKKRTPAETEFYFVEKIIALKTEVESVTKELYVAQKRWDDMHQQMIDSHQEKERVTIILRKISELLTPQKEKS